MKTAALTRKPTRHNSLIKWACATLLAFKLGGLLRAERVVVLSDERKLNECLLGVMNLGKGLNSSHFKRVISFFEVSKFTLNLDTLHLLVVANKGF